MQQLLYRSVAASELGSAEMFEIIESSARNNPARGVTGFLLYVDRVFLQLVEGPAGSLDELLGVLAKDRRHHSIEVLSRQPIEGRSFPRWRMERIVWADIGVEAFVEQIEAAGVNGEAVAETRAFLKHRAAA